MVFGRLKGFGKKRRTELTKEDIKLFERLKVFLDKDYEKLISGEVLINGQFYKNLDRNNQRLLELFIDESNSFLNSLSNSGLDESSIFIGNITLRNFIDRYVDFHNFLKNCDSALKKNNINITLAQNVLNHRNFLLIHLKIFLGIK